LPDATDIENKDRNVTLRPTIYLTDAEVRLLKSAC
jgi:hypothetical protein